MKSYWSNAFLRSPGTQVHAGRGYGKASRFDRGENALVRSAAAERLRAAGFEVFEVATSAEGGLCPARHFSGCSDPSYFCRVNSEVLLGLYVNSREECLREAAECDRLAGLASTLPVRNMMKLAAFQWRKLAEKAAERQKIQWPWVSETTGQN